MKKRANLEPGRSLMHLASRVFNAPLAIWQKKGDVILHLLGPRLGISELPSIDASMLDEEARSHSVADKFDAQTDQGDKPYSVTKDGIAVCEISGTLVRRCTGLDALSGLCSYEQIECELVGAMQDANVKGVLVCLDSPGGEVGGLFDLTDKLYGLKGSKPMHASVSEMACSAAYALASVCDKITVTQTSAAGSIGVYALHVDQSGFDKEMGLKYTYIYAGAHKIDGNPNEPLSADVKAEFQDEINRTYGMFVDTVSQNRKMSAKKVRDTEAQVYYGADAVTMGLADAVGTPDQAMATLRNVVGKRLSNSAKAEHESMEPVASAPEQEVEMPAIPPHKTATSDGPWDASANEKRLRENEAQSYYEKEYAFRDPDGDPTTKSAFSYPHHEVDESGDIHAANIKACESGIGALNGARGGTKLEGEDRKGVYRHLSKHIRDAGGEPAELKSEHLLAAEMALALHTASAPESTKGESTMAKETVDAMASEKKNDEKEKKGDDYMEGKKKSSKKMPKDEEEDEPEDDEDDDEDDEKEEKSKKAKKKAAAPKKDDEEEEDEPKGKKAVTFSQDHITEVVQLCQLAGFEGKSSDFLSKGMSLKEVREALVNLRAEDSGKIKMSSRVGTIASKSMASLESQAAQYARENHISKEKAFSQLLAENPEIYDQYKQAKRADFASN